MEELESGVDVLIIGAGPAGLTAAMWMAQRGIKTQIVEQRPDALRTGGADGLQPRTMEIFESFGIDKNITELWEPVIEFSLWRRDKAGNLGRKQREPNVAPVRTQWGLGLLQQGIIEDIIKRYIKKISPMRVQYNTTPLSLSIDSRTVNDLDAYPCEIRLHSKLRNKGDLDNYTEKTIRAKYVIGADGAKSWTRKQLGFTMDGTRTGSIWGVMDAIVVSNFPDIRTATRVNSETGGLFFIRRERNLTRWYVQLNKGKENEDLPLELITKDIIVGEIQRMLDPFTLIIKYCEWWSCFTINRHLSSGMKKLDRVFLVGDAVHTHSPLAGQGMNTSIQDSYNLGWKLAGVIKKELNPRILATYETERRPVAEELIACDTFLLQMFDTDMAEVPVWMQEREIQILQLNMGFSIEYQDPLLTRPNPERTEVTTQKPDTIIPGRRFPHLTVLNHATAKTCSIQTLLKSDGRFHVVVFAGDISQPSELERLNSCGRTLRRLLARLPRSDMLNIILVHCAPRSSVELGSLDEAFFPVHDLLGWDYDRVHCDIELDYDAAGISRDCGVVLVRPDQHVSWCGELTDLGKLRCRLLIMGLPLRPE